MSAYFTPIDFPNIEPDDWDIFWELWNSNKGNPTINKHNHSEAQLKLGKTVVWNAVEIFDPDTNSIDTSTRPIVDIREKLPRMYDSLMSLKQNFEGEMVVSFIESNYPIRGHTDFNKPGYWMLRSFFYYPALTQQWFFQRMREPESKKTYINMPAGITWFAFDDGVCWHGTDFDPERKKILIKIYGKPSKALIENNIKKYQGYVLDTDDL